MEVHVTGVIFQTQQHARAVLLIVLLGLVSYKILYDSQLNPNQSEWEYLKYYPFKWYPSSTFVWSYLVFDHYYSISTILSMNDLIIDLNLYCSVPGVIGCLQALETIKVATRVGEPLCGRMLLFDALSSHFKTVCHYILCILQLINHVSS